MDSRVNDQAAFILHRRDYQNNSLILELFTRQFGRVSAIVKGAKKRKDISSFQIGNRLSLNWTGKSELKTITQVECRNIAIPVKSIYALFYINELIMLFFAKGDEYSSFFDTYQLFILELSHLNSESSDVYKRDLQVLLRNLELELLFQIGYLPSLQNEAVTGHAISDKGIYRFEGAIGLVPGNPQQQDRSYINGRELRKIQQREFSSDGSLRSAKILTRAIIDFHLQGRTLQSRSLYQKLFSHHQREKHE